MTVIRQKSIHGRKLYITPDDQVVAKNSYVTGGDGKPSIVLPGSPDTTVIFDDFHGDLLSDEWNIIDGDTGGTASSVVVAGTNGILRLDLGSSPYADTGKGQGINSALSWKGNQGSGPTDTKNGLRFGARLKMSGYNDTGRRLNVFAGFTDQVTGVESPIHDSGSGIETNASNAVGFFYGSGADTGWSAMAVNGNADLAVVSLDTTRQALRGGAGSTNNSNVYDTLEFVVHHGSGDTGGTATFYVNGISKGSISAPIAMNIALTPVIYAWAQDTGGGQVVDIDWINISAPRDTGT